MPAAFRLSLILIVSLALLTLATCGKDSPTKPTPPQPPTPPPPQPVPTRIMITPATTTLTAIGQTVQLSATVLDQNGQPVPGAVVTWSSGNAAVATVSAQGLVTAVMNGTAQITARTGNASASISVSVAQSAVRITITPAEATLMALGETVQLSAAVLDQNGQPVDGAVVTWSSSDEAVATVSPQGLVTAVMNGTAQITARAGSASAGVTVNVMVGTSGDREALVALYNSTNGPGWTQNTNWLSNEPLKNWYGVRTNINGEVRSLILLNNNLQGNLPPEIEKLTNLKNLVVRNNQLTGPIPTEIGRLPNLESLDLSINQLTGNIPPELGQLTNLRRLSSYNNQLTGSIPSEIGNLVNLEGLFLFENGLSGPIPPEIGQLVKLQELVFFSNQLTGNIPPEFGQLTNLRILQFHKNPGLTGSLPLEITRLLNLEVLYLTTTLCVPQSVQFQSWISRIASRFFINFCSNSERDALIALYGITNGPNWANDANWSSSEPLEEWYGVTTDTDGRVKELDLQSNNLIGPIPSVISDLNSLKSLNLSFNPDLAGAIPQSISRLNLEALTLEGTMLCASPDPAFQRWLADFPMQDVSDCVDTRDSYYTLATLYNNTNGPGWTNDTNWLTDKPFNTWYGVTTDVGGEVTGLNLSENNLHGPIPLEISQLGRLQRLELWGNRLTGNIPPEIGQLENLNRLQLSNNSLSGAIPPEIGQLSELTQLYLHRNQLAGSIPPEIGRMNGLQQLVLSSNKLTGNIPPEIGRMNGLQQLSLSSNQLTGNIPPEIGQLENVENLQLGHNSLTGAIPPEIGQLGELALLNMGGNQLTGNIPPEIGHMNSLRQLILSGNQLTGIVPPEIGQLENLENLRLYNNSLMGTIPPEIGQLGKLAHLNMSGNRLTGNIPPEFGQLVNIDGIWLNDNELSGSIPPEFGQLKNMTKLYLNTNKLTGFIPPELGMLVMLEELQFSSNRLLGNIPNTFGDLSNLRILDLSLNKNMSGALSRDITRLELDMLLLGGTQLCVSDNIEFKDWLSTIPDSRIGRCEGNMGPADVYLVQGIQSFEYPVPLVAGEDAVLRVFLANETEEDVAVPPVRATFYHDGAVAHSLDIPSNGSSIPTEIDEGNLSVSVNARIPGSIVFPGLEMVVEIDPEASLEPSLDLSGRLPATGRLTIDVRDMPPFDLTMVPFLWTENPDRTTQMQVESLSDESSVFDDLRDLLPVGVLNLEIHEPVWTSVEASWFNCSILLNELTAIQAMDGSTGYYLGVINDVGGLANQPGTVSVSILDPVVIAHELGHNLNLGHAPCGSASYLDPNYPYPNGSIGAWGYDLERDRLVNPNTPDLMSYCGPPNWISDYNYTKAMNYRLSRETATSIATASAPEPESGSLLLWGRVNENGEIILEPSFVVDAPSKLPDMDGPYLLTGEGPDGSVLFNLSFGMSEIADSEGRSFAFILPMSSHWVNRLARITLSGPEGVATLGGDGGLNDRDAPAAALLLDSVTGNVRGILRDWPEPGITGVAARRVLPEPGLDVVISNGVPDAADWDR